MANADLDLLIKTVFDGFHVQIDVEVDVGIAEGRATVWTCDLTHGYIEINADYRS